MRPIAALLALVSVGGLTVREAEACGGGGVVTAETATLGASAQRIVLAINGDTTEVVSQVAVPTTTADYGVLLPVPAQPTLDSNPVSAADLDALERGTAPTLLVESPDDGGGGCGCPFTSGSSKAGAATGVDGGVRVTPPVTIGPVSAVVLTADSGAAVNAWLGENGFAIPPAAQPTVDAYSGPGRYFVAIRRSDAAAPGGPTSIGIHYTMPGDHRSLSMRFAQLGAAPKVAFTVWIAADVTLAPATPFTPLVLDDLDARLLVAAGYPAALESAVAARSGKAFVLEGTWSRSELSSSLGPSLEPLLSNQARLTRLSTIVAAGALDTDVLFTVPYSGPVPASRRLVAASPSRRTTEWAGFSVGLGLGALALGLAFLRRPA
jgi:hypothetical protein